MMRPSLDVTASRPLLLTALLAAALSMGGCVTKSGPEVTGSIAPTTPEGRQQVTEAYGRRYDANPKNPQAALDFAQALKASGQNAQSLAVLQQGALVNPGHLELMAAYGKALLDNGRAKEASEVLARAHRPDRPDWRILSAQGAAADQMGDPALAQKYYEAALRLAPGEPTVMSNLGLSYALSARLADGERVLSEAAASPRADKRVRKNLALVLGLQGRLKEAEAMLRKDQSPEETAATLSSFRRMVAQPNSWDAIRKAGRSAAGPAQDSAPNG
jgi:Flp pilus assembly protein TadD